MIAVIQKVGSASVTIEGSVYSKISRGLMILLGIEGEDNHEDIDWLVRKISNMRIFEDEDGKMNLSCKDIEGQYLVVSQFTLHASTKKGNRPSFIKAAAPAISEPLYKEFVDALSQEVGHDIKTGRFGAMMDVELVNEGPVTIIVDTKDRK